MTNPTMSDPCGGICLSGTAKGGAMGSGSILSATGGDLALRVVSEAAKGLRGSVGTKTEGNSPQESPPPQACNEFSCPVIRVTSNMLHDQITSPNANACSMKQDASRPGALRPPTLRARRLRAPIPPEIYRVVHDHTPTGMHECAPRLRRAGARSCIGVGARSGADA